jgi:hypothetical protein
MCYPFLTIAPTSQVYDYYLSVVNYILKEINVMLPARAGVARESQVQQSQKICIYNPMCGYAPPAKSINIPVE